MGEFKVIRLVCGDSVTVMCTDASREKIDEAVSYARELICDWLDDKELPDDYSECWCDEDFYVTALGNIAGAYVDYSDEIVIEY